MPRITFSHTYQDIISVENLLDAWKEFLKGKRNKNGVKEFQRFLTRNVLELHEELEQRTYRHGGYHAFKISDPKPRDIHKALVRDRLVHHALYRQLYPFFNRTFISDSYSCRLEKGTHLAMNRFRTFAYQVSKNNTRTCWVLKCDIRKFFASIDHKILTDLFEGHIPSKDICWLLGKVITSFKTMDGKGLPLGNLTSQLLVNIYMNEFDQFVKHRLKARWYVRYSDDFVFLSDDRMWLESVIPRVSEFLDTSLKLELHPKKVSIRTIASGVDFLGWIHFFDHRVLRTVAKCRMFRRIREAGGREEIVQSYLGLLQHGNAKKLQKKVAKFMSQ